MAGAFRGHAEQIKAVQHNGIHIVQNRGVTGNHNALRLDGPDHVRQLCAGGFLEVHRQLQLLGDVHRQSRLDLTRLGMDAGEVQHMAVLIIELIIQIRRDGLLGILADVKNHLGIADLGNFLFLAPDGDAGLRKLDLTGGIALRHIAGELAAQLHFLMAQFADIDRGHIEALLLYRGIAGVEFPVRIGQIRLHALDACLRDTGQIGRYPDLGTIQLNNVPPVSLKSDVDGGAGTAVLAFRQHQPIVCQCVLIDILNGDPRNGLGHHPAVEFVHIVPDTGGDHDG